MKKKYLSVILSVLLVFSIVLAISGCNKDDTTIIPNESTNEFDGTEQSTDDLSANENEGSTDENEKETNDTSKPDESEAEVSTNPTETTTDSNEPVTCETCGNIVVNESGSGDISIGNYCDGKCDEWFGELEF